MSFVCLEGGGRGCCCCGRGGGECYFCCCIVAVVMVLFFVCILCFDVVFFQFRLCCGGMSVCIYLELHLLCMGIDC